MCAEREMEQCQFEFIDDSEVRGALQRYYTSGRRAFDAACYPWTVLLAGRAIKTILLDVLTAERTGKLLIPSHILMTNKTLFAKGESDLGRSDSIDLISVAVDRGLVPRDATRLFDPAPEDCSALSMDEWKELAEIAIEVLVSLDRKLSAGGFRD